MKYILIALISLTACTKQYEAPVFWDVKIKQNLTNLEAVAYNTKSTNLNYIWFVNGVKSTGKFVTPVTGRNDVQLSVLDDKGNSVSEYLIFTK